MVGAEWIVDSPTPRRAPPIPTRSEIEREPEPPPPTPVQETVEDSDTDSLEELPPPKQVPPPNKKRRNHRHGTYWTEDEDAALIRAIRSCGWGHWKQMVLSDPVLHGRNSAAVSSHVRWLQRCMRYGDLKQLQ
jgi:hypothetical protein